VAKLALLVFSPYDVRIFVRSVFSAVNFHFSVLVNHLFLVEDKFWRMSRFFNDENLEKIEQNIKTITRRRNLW